LATYYVDAATGNNGDTGLSEALAWATVQFAADTAVAGDKVYVKAGSYAEQVDFDTNAGTPANPIVFEGYTTTTGDGGRATITGSGARASCLVFNGTADHVHFKNFTLTSPTTQCVLGATASTDGLVFDNVQFLKGSGSPSRAVFGGGYKLLGLLKLLRCEISGGFSGDGISGCNTIVTVEACKIIDCGGNGITIGGYGPLLILTDSVIAGNTGDGLNVSSTTSGLLAVGNTFEGNGGDGIDLGGAGNGSVTIRNNIFANHSGAGDVGLRIGAQSGTTNVYCDYNAYYNNTSHRSGNNTTGANDVTLSADPFTNSAADDWSLNNTAGGGADCRDAAYQVG
jgi:hypothetical protein